MIKCQLIAYDQVLAHCITIWSNGVTMEQRTTTTFIKALTSGPKPGPLDPSAVPPEFKTRNNRTTGTFKGRTLRSTSKLQSQTAPPRLGHTSVAGTTQILLCTFTNYGSQQMFGCLKVSEIYLSMKTNKAPRRSTTGFLSTITRNCQESLYMYIYI